MIRTLAILSIIILQVAAVNWPVTRVKAQLMAAQLQAPAGFAVGLYAQNIKGARFMRFTAKGDLLISIPRAGQVIILTADGNSDGMADSARTVLGDLNAPHGLDLYQGHLYIAEEDAVGRVAFDAERGQISGAYERIITGLPADGGHSTRTVRIGPDGKIYLTIGSSCNVCIEEDPRRATMMRYDLDGSNGRIFAAGLRNSVGFDWRPQDGALYATDNGRDLLGDDTPPCELNRIVEGGHYGWPYTNGMNVPDPDYGPGAEAKIAAAIAPAHGFAAHNAPLGIEFVRGENPPGGMKGAALVALHGSWNRSVKDGYKVVSLHWQADGRIEQRDFLWGFLQDGKVTGRPVDVAQGPDGAFYISDDYAGVIYRVVWIAD